MYDPTNIFAKILRKEIPCKKVFENNDVLAFHDLNPLAPFHVLVIPKGAYENASSFHSKASSSEILGFYKAIELICEQFDLRTKGYRLIANTGLDAGQCVFHYHVHILSGRCLGPMLA